MYKKKDLVASNQPRAPRRNKRYRNTKNNKYKNGIIYKIYHKNIENIVYIGSTVCRLSTRWKRHKIGFNSWIKGYTKSKCAICPYIKEFGIKNFNCEVLQKYKITDVNHLNAYEQLWMNKIKNINKNNVFNPIKYYKSHYKQNLKMLLDKLKLSDK